MILLFAASPAGPVNYIAEFNKMTLPPNYDPNKNAAPYYEKAFEKLANLPELPEKLRKTWPADMNEAELNMLKECLNSYSAALDLLKKAAQKPYCWIARHGTDDPLSNIELPEISNLRKISSLLALQAKLMAVEDNMEQALEHVLDLHKIGMHYCGPTTLVERLIAIAIKAMARNTAFEILDREKIPKEALTKFQVKLEKQLLQSKKLNYAAGEKIYGKVLIQHLFTDNGKGSGRLLSSMLYKYKKHTPTPISRWKAIRISLTHPGKSKTLKLFEKLCEKFDEIASQTPWQLYQNQTSHQTELENLTKNNFLLNSEAYLLGDVCEIYHRSKTHVEALVTTIAILRYKTEKNKYPSDLSDLRTYGFLKEIPLDLYSGKPLIYKEVENNFTLYSIGADFDDNGGIPSSWGQGQEGGDQVFWPVKPIL